MFRATLHFVKENQSVWSVTSLGEIYLSRKIVNKKNTTKNMTCLQSQYKRINDYTTISGSGSKTIKQLLPLGWNIFEINLTVGALFGYSSVNSMVSLKVPVAKKNENNTRGENKIEILSCIGCNNGRKAKRLDWKQTSFKRSVVWSG